MLKKLRKMLGGDILTIISYGNKFTQFIKLKNEKLSL
jgi:hypothetical protein